MRTPVKGLIKLNPRILLLTLASGCAFTVNDGAICDGTLAARKAHAQALVEDGGDSSVVTGAALLTMMKSGCKET